MSKFVAPQSGPQRMFAESPADFCLFAGMPGSGKTAALVLELGRWSHVKHYGAAAFRRNSNQLFGSGSLWGLASKWWPQTGAEMVRSPVPTARWAASDASVEMHHLQYDGDVEAHDGKEYCALIFDELPHFTEGQFWYLSMRNRSTCGVRPFVRASAMASPDSWIRELVRPWVHPDGWPNDEMSGVLRWFVRDPRTDKLVWFEHQPDADAFARDIRETDPRTKVKPKSFSVIHSRTADNAILTAADPNYESVLANLPREQRLQKQGNWEARPPSSGMFDRAWFLVHESVDPAQIAFSVRGWDKAATLPHEANKDPDWTRGVRLDCMRNGLIVVSDVVGIRDRPGKVDALYASVAEQDGPQVTQAFWCDPGQAGVVDEEHTRHVLSKVSGCGPTVFSRATKNKIEYAKPASAYADPSTPGRMAIVRATWNGPFFAELDAFPTKGAHDDQVDAMSRAWLEVAERKFASSGGWMDAVRGIRFSW